jgi:glycosyltransferase involved in cell wall biosynthesis
MRVKQMNIAKNPKVSVIIPVLNMANTIEQCLKSIFNQTYEPFEVIVVDGHSTDGTVDIAKTYPVRILYNDRVWPGAGRQYGVENSEGDYVAFTDADCILPNTWIETLLSEFTDDVAGVGGGAINVGEGLWIQSINSVLSTFLGGGNSAQNRPLTKKREEKDINAYNCIYRKKDYIESGGFNVHLRGAEEPDLGRRVLKIGKLIYTPNAMVIHDHKRQYKQFAKQMYSYGRWRRESKVWSLTVVPPLLTPLLLLTLIINYWIFPIILGVYCVAIMSEGLKFAIQNKDIRFFFTIPIVFITQHILYIIGFWRETILPTKRVKINTDA